MNIADALEKLLGIGNGYREIKLKKLLTWFGKEFKFIRHPTKSNSVVKLECTVKINKQPITQIHP